MYCMYVHVHCRIRQGIHPPITNSRKKGNKPKPIWVPNLDAGHLPGPITNQESMASIASGSIIGLPTSANQTLPVNVDVQDLISTSIGGT